MTQAPRPYFVSEGDPPAKQAILTAAMALFATRGVDGVTIRDIAAAAGYSNPAMFKHFRTKDELAESLFQTCYRRLAYALSDSADLSSAVEAALSLIEASPESVHFVLENLRRYFRTLPSEVRARSLPGAMGRLIEAAQIRGEIRASLNRPLAAALILGLLAQIARMAHFGEAPARPTALTNDVMDLIHHGLGA